MDEGKLKNQHGTKINKGPNRNFIII